jgi:hypothetical protein
MTMAIFSHRRVSALLVMLAATVFLAGCGTLGPATPERAVSQRALEYWNARKAGQLDKAYALTTPSYRKLRTEAQFMSRLGSAVTFESAEVYKAECQSEKCNVRMKLAVKPALPRLNLGIIDTYLDEIWLLEDGQWWRHQDL